MRTPVTDQLLDILLEIKEETTRNTTTLEDHQRRSVASEERLELQEKKFEEFEKRIEPLLMHFSASKLLLRWVVGVLGIVGTIAAIIQALSH
jgi:hypothetical protein